MRMVPGMRTGVVGGVSAFSAGLGWLERGLVGAGCDCLAWEWR